MIGILFLTLGIIFGVIWWLTGDKFVHARSDSFSECVWGVITCCSCFICIAGIIGSIVCAIVFCLVHNSYLKQKKLEEYTIKRNTIIWAISKGSNDEANGLLTLSDSISEYNIAITNGRRAHDSIWFSALTYDFYYDLELIDIEIQEV